MVESFWNLHQTKPFPTVYIRLKWFEVRNREASDLKLHFLNIYQWKIFKKTGRGDVPGYRVRIFFLKFFVVVPDMVGQLLTYGRKLFEQILFFWTGLVYSIHYTSRAQMGHLSKHISGTLTAGYWTAIRTTSARYWSWFYTDYRHAIGRLLQQTGYNIG